ncbi:MAG: TraB/GumN family protein [Plesiomonas sp.]|uniref:TraB/GumN family protein n=1 Tax=Plesiomonas sp. TaxID=2486279 RepID=UPI003F3030A4
MKKLLTRLALWLGLLSPLAQAYPAVDVRLDDVDLELVGSIHMASDRLSTLPPELLRKLDNIDALIVEADITADTPLAKISPPEKPLSALLTPSHIALLKRYAQETGISADLLNSLHPWQAALTLQSMQAQKMGMKAEYGVDYQILHYARQRGLPIIELEGSQAQMNILETLEDNGLPLLIETLEEWNTTADTLRQVEALWVTPNGSEPTLHNIPDLADGLHSPLLAERNQKWADKLKEMPAGRYMVVVGALHLIGKDNLPQLLKTPSATKTTEITTAI